MSDEYDSLVEFVKARLDEDDEMAKAAVDTDFDDGRWRYDGQSHPRPCIVGAAWESSIHSGIWDCEDPEDDCEQVRRLAGAAGEHIARHDPARALREVAAKRAILARWEFARDQVAVGAVNEGAGYGPADAGWPLRADSHDLDVRSLAAIWSDHPDYEEAWRP